MLATVKNKVRAREITVLEARVLDAVCDGYYNVSYNQWFDNFVDESYSNLAYKLDMDYSVLHKTIIRLVNKGYLYVDNYDKEEWVRITNKGAIEICNIESEVI